MDGPKGLSDHEILMKIWATQEAFIKAYHRDQKLQDDEIAKRPRRGELVGYLTAAGVLSGIMFQILSVMG